MKARSRAVFLDRDGTINRDVPYCSYPEEFELLPMVAEGIRLIGCDVRDREGHPLRPLHPYGVSKGDYP